MQGKLWFWVHLHGATQLRGRPLTSECASIGLWAPIRWLMSFNVEQYVNVVASICSKPHLSTSRTQTLAQHRRVTKLNTV